MQHHKKGDKCNLLVPFISLQNNVGLTALSTTSRWDGGGELALGSVIF